MGLIGQTQQTTFADPQAGQSPISAAVVRGNDNALVAKHNQHDADATIHVQTGLLSARPAASVAGAMYLDENGILYRDNGAAWAEVGYARLAASSNTFTGNVAVNGGLAVDGNTALSTTGVTGNLTVSGTASAATLSGAHTGDGSGLTALPSAELTGALPALDGSALTNLTAANLAGTLPAVSGANLTSLNATNVSSGTLNDARLPGTMTAKTIAAVTVTAGGGATVIGSGDDMLNLNASAAAAFTASGANSITTLDNCPVASAGNTIWLRVEINGNVAYIPCVR
jgi:hypothetical protein